MTEPYLVVDAHEDLAYNALIHGRDLETSAAAIRAAETVPISNGIATIGFPDLLAGNVRVVFGTVYASPIDSELAGKKSVQHS